jgi:exosortase
MRNLLFLLSSVILLVFMSRTLSAVLVYASDLDNKDASQIFLVPFVSAALLFLNRKKIFGQVEYGVLGGALMASAAILLGIASRKWGPQLDEGDRIGLSMASFLVLWLACFLLFYGRHAFRAAMFPLLFLLFSIPIPSVILDPLIAVLRQGSTEISVMLLRLSGTPLYRDGFLLTMPCPQCAMPPRLTVDVAPECSGIRSFISMVILGLIAGNVLLESNWRRVALILVAIPVMIFKNALRIATLSLLTIHVDPGILASRLHREGGIPFFVVGLALIYPFLALLIRSERRNRTMPQKGEPETALPAESL